MAAQGSTSPIRRRIDEALSERPSLDLSQMKLEVKIDIDRNHSSESEIKISKHSLAVQAFDAEEAADALVYPLLSGKANLTLIKSPLQSIEITESSIEQKICPILATHPFQEFELYLLEFENTGMEGRLLEALSRNTSPQRLSLWKRLHNMDGTILQKNEQTSNLLQHLLLNPSCTLPSLRILDWPFSDLELARIASTLATNAMPPTLKSLEIGRDFSDKQVLSLIKALETNTTLTSFSVGPGHRPIIIRISAQDLYEAVIDLLSVNFTLKKLDLSRTDLGSDRDRMSAIASMLQDEEASEALALLHNFPKVQPTSACVFLCGNGWAGKTTLQKTIVNLMDDNDNLINMVRQFKNSLGMGKQPERTAGIEVTRVNFCDIEISFWDLAGQKEYHAFHDLMIPHEQGPSLFLITCNLTDKGSQEQAPRCAYPKPLEDIAAELRYWLRYISSNNRKTRTLHVSFVFTHVDKLGSHGTAEFIKDRIEALRKELEQEFDSLVKVAGSTFFVDGRMPKAVQSLLEHTIKEVREIASKCQPVFSVCNDAKQWITKWMKGHPHEPWMKKNDLIKLCSKELYDSKSSSRQRTEAVGITQAILFDLHRMGNLIHFKEQDIVLVNVQWFCKDFMGRILEQTTQVSMDSRYADDEKLGVWKREDIKSMLERLCNTERMPQKRNKKLDGDQLINLMIQLEFCFEVDPGNKIFIPATLCGSKWQTHRRWTAEVGKPVYEFGYVGRRLECEDRKRTFLTPGFFPRLQVHLRNVLKSSRYDLEKDLIKIVDDRVEILIEFNEAPECFIDIMVRFSKSKHLDHVLDFISLKVIQSIRDFQRKSGCWQGVYLVEVALRPSCVEKLIMPQIKLKQSVSLEELKTKVLENGLVDDIENITYAWSSLESASLGEEYTPIIELIGERCFTDILSKGLAKAEELSKQLGLSKGDASLISSLTEEHLESSLEKQLNRIEAKIDVIAKDIKDVKGAIGRLLNGLIPEVHRLLIEFCNVNSARSPQFFLFKDDKTLVSKLVPGLRNLRLNFMCESHPMPHLPSDQKGIKVSILDEGAVRSIQPYLHFLLSALALGFKLGAPMAQALGIMVPELSSLIDSLRVKSQRTYERSQLFPGDECCGGNQVGFDPVVLEKARIWVQDFMREKECNNESQIQKKFGLLKKQYRDGRCAWLCEDHYRHAI